MVPDSQLRGTPFPSYNSSEHDISASLKGQSAINYKDELQYRPRPSTASSTRRLRPLLASVAAVSAVVFITYVCSVSIGKRIAAVPFGRKLADRRGGEECDVSQASQRTGSSAEASSEGQQAMIAHIEALQAQSGNVVPTSSADATTAAPDKVISGTGSAQLETRGMQGRFKRRGEKHTDLDMAAKQSRLETVVEETPLQPPPPPLDPGLDSLIDSVLFGINDPSSEDIWLADELQLHPTADSSFGSMPSRSVSESAAIDFKQVPPLPPLDPGLDSLIDSVLAGAAATVSKDLWLTDEPQQRPSVDYSVGLRPAVLGGASETPMAPTPHRPPPALDPSVDPRADSVLSRVEHLTSEDVWIHDAVPLHPTPGSSSVSMSPALTGDSELLGGNPVERNIEYVLPSVTSTLPGVAKRVIEGRNVGEPPLADTSGHQMQRRPPVGAESVYSGPSPDAAEVTMGPPQELTAQPLAFAKERMASSSEEPVDDSLPSSSGDSPDSWQLPSGVTLFQYSGSVVQSAPVEELPTDATVTSHFRWLGDLFPAIPVDVLRTHPFYRHPQGQQSPIARPFNEGVVTFFAKFQKLPNPALAECREILKKSSLTRQDIENLVAQAERVCGHAMEQMRIGYRRPHPMFAVEALGTIFIVLDTLHCVAEVLGDRSMKQYFWPRIFERIDAARFAPVNASPKNCLSVRNAEIASTLMTALEYYRRGLRPPVLMVVGLKATLFCRPGSTKFKAEQWEPWRQDAAEWRDSLQLNVAWSNK